MCEELETPPEGTKIEVYINDINNLWDVISMGKRASNGKLIVKDPDDETRIGTINLWKYPFEGTSVLRR